MKELIAFFCYSVCHQDFSSSIKAVNNFMSENQVYDQDHGSKILQTEHFTLCVCCCNNFHI